MIASIVFKGPLITDTSIAGERKSDGVIPAHPGGGALRLSKDRWIIFFATLDAKGFDLNRSILYQIRKDAPDGTIIREGVVAQCEEDWHPFGPDSRFVKSCGMPIAFGVPKGAMYRNELRINQNVFAVKWYRLAHLRRGSQIVNPLFTGNWPDGPDIAQQTLRVEWAQFRLNQKEDDIEIILKPQLLAQGGYEGDLRKYTSLGPDLSMNHSMKPPVPADDSCMEWVEVDTFVPYGKKFLHGSIAAVGFRFNAQKGIYEWKKTGKLLTLADRIIGEACLNRLGKHWVISARSFAPDGATCWFSADDPFSEPGNPQIIPNAPSPRTSFLCADNVIRLFANDASSSTNTRNPLCCREIDLPNHRGETRHIIMDAHACGMPFFDPFVDMAKLSPPCNNRQLLFYRVIAERQTGPDKQSHPITSREHELAGIYYSEIHYESEIDDCWSF